MSDGTNPHWTRGRRVVQLVVLGLYVALPFANLHGFRAINGTLAALNIGPVDLIEPAGALSTILASRRLPAILLLGIAPLVGLALVLGPVFCSWICPWGLISEGIDRLRRGRRRSWPARPWLEARRVRLASLLAFAGASVVIGTPVVALISPPRLVTSSLFELVYFRFVSPVTLTLLAAVLLVELLAPRRLWCRAVCPVGGLSNYLRHRRTLSARAAAPCTCSTQPICLVHCAWGVDPRHMAVTDGCTNCFRCLDVCPAAALRAGFGAERSSAPPAR